MKFTPAALQGAYLVEPTPLSDERGFFARCFCDEEFSALGLATSFKQCSVSFNEHRGTLRGMHYQVAPHEEHKLVRCTAGSIFDVIVDLRPQSPQYRRWFGVELSAANHQALYIPPGFAHGFVSLSAASEVYYMISAAHSPEHARGCRWNDPALGIVWPLAPSIMSPRDASYPLLDSAA